VDHESRLYMYSLFFSPPFHSYHDCLISILHLTPPSHFHHHSTIHSTIHSHRKFAPSSSTEKQSNCRSGTPQAKNASAQSHHPTTAAHTESSSSTTSPTTNPSTTSSNGSTKSTDMHAKTSTNSSLVTNPI
jgi:hypothetical protein